MHKMQIETILIRILYLFAVGIVVFTVLGTGAVASALFNMTFFLVVLLWCAVAMRKVVWTDAVLLLIIGIALGNVVVNAWLEETKIGFAYFKKYIMFISTLIFFQAAHRFPMDGKTKKYLLTLNSILAAFLSVYYLQNQSEVYMLNGRVTGYLTFRFTNPNLTALFLMCIFTGELFQIFEQKSVVRRLVHLVFAAAVCFFIWETESRNCLITIAVETILCLLLYCTKRGFRLPKWFVLMIAVWPFVFLFVYLGVVQNRQVQEWLSFMVSEGKGLDTRITIWIPALRYYADSPFLGAYSQISRGTGMSQMHNTHLDIIVSYGTIVFVLVCYLLYKIMCSQDGDNPKEDTMARICFAGTIIMGMGEAALFSGGLGIYVFAGMFLLLCSREGENSGKPYLIGGKLT